MVNNSFKDSQKSIFRLRVVGMISIITLSIVVLTYILSSTSTAVTENATNIEHKSLSSSFITTAVVILGGGLTKDGELPVHSILRVKRAIELYRKLDEKAIIIPLSGGTPHKPNPLDSNGFPIWEATAAAKKLIELGIPPDRIFEENFSLDTVGNAYFLRAIHITPGRFETLHIVTNSWHMARTKSIFTKVFSLPDDQFSKSPMSESFSLFSFFTRRQASIRKHVSLVFEEVAPGIDDEAILAARIKREGQSLESFDSKVAPLWNTFQQMHMWIFKQHEAYRAQRILAKKDTPNLSPDVLKTY